MLWSVDAVDGGMSDQKRRGQDCLYPCGTLDLPLQERGATARGDHESTGGGFAPATRCNFPGITFPPNIIFHLHGGARMMGDAAARVFGIPELLSSIIDSIGTRDEYGYFQTAWNPAHARIARLWTKPIAASIWHAMTTL